MTKDTSNLPPGDSVHGDPLSPTGMFRHVFEQNDENAATPQAPANLSVQGGQVPTSIGELPDASAGPAGSPEPGEFTRLFQRVQPASSAATGEAAGDAATPADASGAGEFTRIFLNSSAGRNPEGAQKPGNDAVGVQQRGFSSPGRTGSAAAEGSVIQLFRAPSTTPLVPSSRREVDLESPGINSAASAQQLNQPMASSEVLFRSPEAAPAASTPSITHLLESLSAPDRRPSEPVPSSPQSPPVSPVESSGVTRFIQKLGEEPAVVREAPPEPAPPPAKSGPGEYTRVVARLEEKPVTSNLADAAAAKAPPGRLAAPAVSALPAVPVVATPPALKPAPSAATAPKKTTLEAITPLLLVLNTILLVAVLLLLIVLLRSR